MNKPVKFLIFGIAGITVAAIFSFCLIFYVGKRNAEDVKSICQIEIGTALEDVLPRARDLGFSEAEQGALDGGLIVQSGGVQVTFTDDALPGLEDGSIRVGKTSLPPFLRNYCEISFYERKVIGTRLWTID